MSNNPAEIAQPGRSEIQTQAAPTPQFDALQLHMEGAGRAPGVVPDNNLTAAVFTPTENGAHLVEAQYRGGQHFDGRDYGRDRYYGPNVGAAIAGTLLYDTMVAPYAYPGYGPGYAAPPVCEPQYYGPPVCYNAPEPLFVPGVPYYGRERIIEPRRYYEERRDYRWHR